MGAAENEVLAQFQTKVNYTRSVRNRQRAWFGDKKSAEISSYIIHLRNSGLALSRGTEDSSHSGPTLR